MKGKYRAVPDGFNFRLEKQGVFGKPPYMRIDWGLIDVYSSIEECEEKIKQLEFGVKPIELPTSKTKQD